MWKEKFFNYYLFSLRKQIRHGYGIKFCNCFNYMSQYAMITQNRVTYFYFLWLNLSVISHILWNLTCILRSFIVFSWQFQGITIMLVSKGSSFCTSKYLIPSWNGHPNTLFKFCKKPEITYKWLSLTLNYI